VTTLLAGDGGDELFAGNERYATDKRFSLYRHVPAFLRKGLIEPVASLLPQNESRFSLPRRYVKRANIPLPRRIILITCYSAPRRKKCSSLLYWKALHRKPG